MKRLHLKKKRKPFPVWLIEKFKSFRWINWTLYCMLLFFVGTIINHVTRYRFPHFVTHQLLLITATTMLVYAMKIFFLDIDKLNSHGPEGLLKNPETKSLYLNRLLPIQRTYLAPVISLVITVFFFSCIVMLEYIELDCIGAYALYIAGSSVLIGAYGYVQYLCFLWFVYQAGKLEYRSESYNIYTPAATPWVSQLAKTSQKLRSFFLWIGLIYVIEYAMLVPTDKISFEDDKISLDTPNNAAFLISWLALFLLVIIAFPVINHYQRKFVTDLVEKLKEQTVQDLSALMAEEKRNQKDKRVRMSMVITYSVIIENIRHTKSYPTKQLFGYETAMTFVTFIVHMLNLYSKIVSIPQLSTILS
ncbi:MAG: hypothetical protein HDT27_01780 [Subdoligranulum sp.]|nr:hypothetical protein [Subdoligranulum sp.]